MKLGDADKPLVLSAAIMICQDCWEPTEDNPLCICKATYEPCPIHVHKGIVFTTPQEKQDGVCPINCPQNPRQRKT